MRKVMSEQGGQSDRARGEQSVDAGLARPGAITYLHIPAQDVREAARFYRDVFGWTINNPDSDRPSFDDPGGRLSGAWMSDQVPSREPGLLPYIYVDQMDESVRRILDHGGQIVTEPHPTGGLTVATFRDLAGNVIVLWHDTTR